MWREYVRMALRALYAHKFRSSLTVSSITLGAFSIVLMMSLATSGLTTLSRDIEELGGARIILIASKKPERVRNRDEATTSQLTLKDRDALFAAVPHLDAKSMYATLERRDVTNDHGKAERTDFVAADGGFFRVLGLKLEDGRFFTEEENRSHARVCVIAHKLAKQLYDGKAVGRWITVDDDRCEIVGQLAKVEHWDTNFGFEWLHFLAMPLETAADTRAEVRARSGIQMRTTHVSKNDIVKRIANVILVDRHRGVDDFQIWDFNAFMAQFQMIFTIMEAVVGLIAGIALLVGGIGVMNMMLVSVSERTREIGIRKALGASPRAIAIQFLCEATVLSGFGGLVGTAAGIGAAIGVNIFIKSLKDVWVGEISEPAVIIALVVSLAIGVTFGFFPAQRASRLDPVLAIRR
jgi:putative ABC transport system permease protein